MPAAMNRSRWPSLSKSTKPQPHLTWAKGPAPAPVRRVTSSKQPVAQVAVEDRQFPCVRGHEEIQPAVVVVVAALDPHAPQCGPSQVVSESRCQPRLPRTGPARRSEQEIAGHVVQHEDVGVAVAVVVGADHAHAGAGGEPRCPTSRLISVNVPSPLLRYSVVGLGRIVLGPGVVGEAVDGPVHVCLVGELDVVGDVQVQVAVPVDVQEAGAGADRVAVAPRRPAAVTSVNVPSPLFWYSTLGP